MFEYVKDAGLKFNGSLTKRRKTDLIIPHHVEGTMSVQAIHQMHLDRGHKGIDYNIYIDKDGKVYWGRGLEYEGGHVSNSYSKTKGINARSVGIVCNGNFLKEKMSDAQKNALKQVVADVMRYYKFESSAQIVSHKEAAGSGYTDCPGTNFPTEEVREYIRQGGQPTLFPTPQPTPAENPNKPIVYTVKVGTLNMRKEPNGKVIKKLKRGDKLALQRYVKGENWARAMHGKTEGWVWLDYIGE